MDGVGEAFRATLDMFQTGIDMMRQNLRRRHPEAAEHDLDRPGAEAGDSAGRAYSNFCSH